MSRRSTLAVMLSFVLGVAALVTAPLALARDGESVDRRACSEGSNTRIRVYVGDDGRLDVIGVVWSDDEDFWTWKMLHDGDVSANGEMRARDADRSLRIQRSMLNFSGPHDIAFRAVNNRTDEVCRVEVVF